MSDRIPTGTRVLAWSGLVALAVTRYITTLLPLGEQADTAALWVISLIPIPMSAVASFVVYRRVRGEERRFWLLLALATTLLTFSESFWAYSVVFVDPMGVALPHPFELLQAAAAFLFYAMLITFTRFGAEPLAVRARHYADVGMVLVIGFVAAYHWLVTPLFAGIPRHSTGLLLVASAYPVLGVSLVAGTFLVLVGFKVYRWRPWERLFAAALSVYAAGILFWPWWYLGFQTSAVPAEAGATLEYILMSGHYLLFVACVYRLADHEGPGIPRTVSAPLGRWPWLAWAYPGVMTLFVPVLVFASIRTEGHDDARVYLGAAVVLVSLIAVRSWLASVEAGDLFSRAMSDPVTGLGNRRALEATLETAPPGWRGAAVVLDVDGFGRVNEISGHPEGDRVLRHVSFVLGRAVGGRGDLYRIGGDDFVAILPGVSPDDATSLATECVLAVERQVRSGSMPIALSAGVAHVGRDADRRSLSEIVSAAEAAQRCAYLAGGGRVHRAVDGGEEAEAQPAAGLRQVRRGRYLAAIRALAAAVDGRDPQASDHSRNVAAAARALATEIGLAPSRIDAIETAALLHDIGKLGIDDGVLRQKRDLSAAERSRVEEHTELGERMLASARVDEMLPWVRHHHERWDGSGYPDRLAGEAIPLEARILAIADAYDTMTTARSYRDALDHRAALRQIELEAGAQFDPTLAAAFVRVMWSPAS